MNAQFVRDYLARALEGDRLAHAYLLWGPASDERDRAAREIATAFVCAEGRARGMSPCGACRPCREVVHGTSAAFLELPADKPKIEIDDVREIAGKLAVAYESRRVVFLPRLERLTLPAAHAFLKILEEPGGLTLYFFTTGRVSSLLPTIISRCHRLPFYAASADTQSADHADLDAFLADPARRAELDMDVLGDYVPGEDKRERLRAFLAHLCTHLELRMAELCGGQPGAPTIFGALDLEQSLLLAEKLLLAAEDVEANVNPDLLVECLAIELRRLPSAAQ